MCDNIICEYLFLASMAVMDGIACGDLTYDDLNRDVFENVVLGLLIKCVIM